MFLSGYNPDTDDVPLPRGRHFDNEITMREFLYILISEFFSEFVMRRLKTYIKNYLIYVLNWENYNQPSKICAFLQLSALVLCSTIIIVEPVDAVLSFYPYLDLPLGIVSIMIKISILIIVKLRIMVACNLIGHLDILEMPIYVCGCIALILSMIKDTAVNISKYSYRYIHGLISNNLQICIFIYKIFERMFIAHVLFIIYNIIFIDIKTFNDIEGNKILFMILVNLYTILYRVNLLLHDRRYTPELLNSFKYKCFLVCLFAALVLLHIYAHDTDPYAIIYYIIKMVFLCYNTDSLIIHLDAAAHNSSYIDTIYMRFPTGNFTSNKFKQEHCTICLSDNDAIPICTLPCKHVYHVDCIKEWFNSSGLFTCPLCKTEYI